MDILRNQLAIVVGCRVSSMCMLRDEQALVAKRKRKQRQEAEEKRKIIHLPKRPLCSLAVVQKPNTADLEVHHPRPKLLLMSTLFACGLP